MEKNENNNQSQQLLKEALDETMEKEIKGIPSDLDIQKNHTFSKEYNQKINEIGRGKKKRSIYRIMRPIAAVVIVLAGLGVIASSVGLKATNISEDSLTARQEQIKSDNAEAGLVGDSPSSGITSDSIQAETSASSYDSSLGLSDSVANYEALNPEAEITPKILEQDKKLIKTVNLWMETKEFDKLYKNLLTSISNVGGYVENSNIQGNSSDDLTNRYGDFIIRIPVEELDIFLDSASDLGNIISRQESINDITLQYVDMESHKTALETEKERLLTIMEEADNVEDIIAIETRLSQVRYELEYYASTLNVYNNQISYSTVTINVQEVERITILKTEGIWSKIVSKASENINKITERFISALIWVTSSVPYFIIIGVVVVMIIIIVKKRKKRIR